MTIILSIAAVKLISIKQKKKKKSIAAVPGDPVVQEILLALFVLEGLVCRSFHEHQQVQILPKNPTKLTKIINSC